MIRKLQFFISILLLITVSTISTGNEWRQFTLGSIPQFIVQGNVTGRVKSSKEYVYFEIQSATIRLNPSPDSKKSEKLIGLSFGLAYETDTGKWDSHGFSAIKPIPAILLPNNKVEVPPYTIRMPLPSSMKDNNYWVVLEMRLYNGKHKYAFTYAHELEILNKSVVQQP